MSPKKSKKATKPKKTKGKTKTRMPQVQTTQISVRVRTDGGGGGGVSAPIVYATYAPPPPTQLAQFVYDDGLPPAPNKQEPRKHISAGVSHTPKNPARPQSHSCMSPLSRYL